MNRFEFLEIYIPKNEEDWYMFKVNNNRIYSFRLGGIKEEMENEIDYNKYNLESKVGYTGILIEKILTDDECVYLILENGNVIVSGWVSIDNEGLPSLGLRYKKCSDFESDFFLDEEFKEIAY
ncbi:MAG: hypothetical protein ACK5UE_07140 [Chitinophagales bacterium]|jgi:hypothetical protein